MIRITLLILAIFNLNLIFGQGYFNHWHFGQGASLDFNSGVPIVTNNSAIDTQEGCASISDYNGNLLFYTDGITVWNRKHLPMFNGTGLKGHKSSTQSALIVRFPNDSLKYYLFTVSNNLSPGELRYSIIDLSLDNGFGGIRYSKKNILLGTNYTEKLVAAKGNCGVWVLTHKRDNNEFFAYLVDGNGISNPVVTAIGSSHNKKSYTGTMKVSPNNKKIALATLMGIVEVFDFNYNTGVLSNIISLPTDVNSNSYGLCFSPNNKLLYVGENINFISKTNIIYQYNLSSGIDTLITKSKTAIGSTTSADAVVFDIQLGPDNKLYVSRSRTKYLDLINNPNELGISCNYVYEAIDFGVSIIRVGLPNALKFSSKTTNIDLGNDRILCNGDSLLLDVSIQNTTYLWQDNSSSSTFTVNSPGTYWVKLTNSCGLVSDTIEVKFDSIPIINIGNDTSLCQGEKLILDISSPRSSYLWQDNSTNPILEVNSPGSYWAKITNSCGTDSDTIQVKFDSIPNIDLGNDTTLCKGEKLILDITSTNAKYLWKDNSTNPIYLVENSGKYWAEISNSCGSRSDTIIINYDSIPGIEFGNDTILCQGEKLILDISSPNANYLWQDNSTNPTYLVEKSGKYWAEISNGCGKLSDTITVKFDSIPIINLGNDTTLCKHENLILDITSPNANYLWKDNSTNPTLEVSSSGKYWAQLTNNCGSVTDTIIIDYDSIPEIDLGNDTILCENESIILDVKIKNADYVWQDNSTNSTFEVDYSGEYWVNVTNICGTINDSINIFFDSIPNINLGKDTTLCQGEKLILDVSSLNHKYIWQDNSTNSDFEINSAGKYWVKVSNNCGNVSDTIEVEYAELPSIYLGNDTTLCLGSNLLLDVSIPNATYEWQDNSTDPVFNIESAGEYWVKINSCGVNSDTILVQFEDCKCNIYVPNIFSPNDDSVNDNFFPEFNCLFSEYSFMIFNRWGEKVFETKDSNTSWDGRFKGQNVPSGVYVYFIKYQFANQKNTESLFGDITLIR